MCMHYAFEEVYMCMCVCVCAAALAALWMWKGHITLPSPEKSAGKPLPIGPQIGSLRLPFAQPTGINRPTHIMAQVVWKVLSRGWPRWHRGFFSRELHPFAQPFSRLSKQFWNVLEVLVLHEASR